MKLLFWVSDDRRFAESKSLIVKRIKVEYYSAL